MEHYYKNIKGWFAFEQQYRKMFDELPADSTWIEIGSFHGRSLAWLLVESTNKNKKFKVHCVDRWDGDPLSPIHHKFNDNTFENFKKNLAPFLDQFVIHKKNSWDAAGDFDDSTVDYAMIDAGHDYDSVTKDIRAWWPKIRSGGYLGGDDYGLDLADGVHQAVDEFVKINNLKLELIPSIKKTGSISKKAKNWLICKT